MFVLKPISQSSVANALAKAERYRLLNEPDEAESICRDVLEAEPENQQALISLALALTDQIPQNPRVFAEALAVTGKLESGYDQAYYAGIAWERRARARFHAGGHDAKHQVYDWIVRALEQFAEAESLRPEAKDEAVLRWNTCVRMLQQHPEIAPQAAEVSAGIMSE